MPLIKRARHAQTSPDIFPGNIWETIAFQRFGSHCLGQYQTNTDSVFCYPSVTPRHAVILDMSADRIMAGNRADAMTFCAIPTREQAMADFKAQWPS